MVFARRTSWAELVRRPSLRPEIPPSRLRRTGSRLCREYEYAYGKGEEAGLREQRRFSRHILTAVLLPSVRYFQFRSYFWLRELQKRGAIQTRVAILVCHPLAQDVDVLVLVHDE